MSNTQRIAVAIGALGTGLGLLIQYYVMIKYQQHHWLYTTITFFSYFTILSNILVASYFVALALFPNSRFGLFCRQASVATALAIYILVVGVVYNLMLRHTWEPTGLLIVADELMHSFTPIYFLLYWLLLVPKKSIAWKHMPLWLLFPLLFLIYTFVRGHFTQWYPYPFFDVTQVGYAQAGTSAAGLSVMFIILAAVFVILSKLLARRE